MSCRRLANHRCAGAVNRNGQKGRGLSAAGSFRISRLSSLREVPTPAPISCDSAQNANLCAAGWTNFAVLSALLCCGLPQLWDLDTSRRQMPHRKTAKPFNISIACALNRAFFIKSGSGRCLHCSSRKPVWSNAAVSIPTSSMIQGRWPGKCCAAVATIAAPSSRPRRSEQPMHPSN